MLPAQIFVTQVMHAIEKSADHNPGLPKQDESQQYTVQVASALVKLDAPESLSMAVIPMGTANDFATSIGLPEDPWEALQLCTMDTAQPIDVGLVNDKVRGTIQPQLT